MSQLPIPEFFDSDRVSQLWRVPYADRAAQAKTWAEQHDLSPASADDRRICLLLIDVQNTFCLPDYELFVAGRSGRGAIEDNIRLCKFIYRHLGQITNIVATMDTHRAMQIFHPFFWVDGDGNNPPPMTEIVAEEVEAGKWNVNPAIVPNLQAGDYEKLQRYALHYAKLLNNNRQYPLMVWPYHGMLGGVGHALVSAIEEACFFHSIARRSQIRYEQKGTNPLTENYSALKPEVLEDEAGNPIDKKNTELIEYLLGFDAVIVAGQAKSHCVAWTVSNFLEEINARDRQLASKVYLLDDCTSPVVVPDVVDYTDAAEAAFDRFAEAGMHRIKSTETI